MKPEELTPTLESMRAALALPFYEHPILEEVTWRGPMNELVNRELFGLTGADIINFNAREGRGVDTTMAAAFTLAPMILTGIRFESPAPEVRSPHIVWKANAYALLVEPIARPIQTWKLEAPTFVPVETRLSIRLDCMPEDVAVPRILRIMIFGYEVPAAHLPLIRELGHTRRIIGAT